jgi:hypothetical protein
MELEGPMKMLIADNTAAVCMDRRQVMAEGFVFRASYITVQLRAQGFFPEELDLEFRGHLTSLL